MTAPRPSSKTRRPQWSSAKTKRKSRNWKRYAIAAAGVITGAAGNYLGSRDAHGEIVYYDPADATARFENLTHVLFDIDNSSGFTPPDPNHPEKIDQLIMGMNGWNPGLHPGADFSVSTYYSASPYIYGIYYNRAFCNGPGLSFYSQGESIGPESPGDLNAYGNFNRGGGALTPWFLAALEGGGTVTGYAGLAFETAPFVLHYGWIRMTYDPTSNPGFHSVTIHDFAYETIAGVAILTGAGAPTSPQPGDFDGDGDVDGADFVAWQTNFPKESGATLADGDADGDGDVDGADFVVWQTNFPFTPGPGSSSVPEPNALLLAALGAGGLAALRRRRKKAAAASGE